MNEEVNYLALLIRREICCVRRCKQPWVYLVEIKCVNEIGRIWGIPGVGEAHLKAELR